MSSVGEEFPKEQERCRQLLATYKSLAAEFGTGVNTKFAELVVEDVLRRADQAMASGDIVAILRTFKEMQELE